MATILLQGSTRKYQHESLLEIESNKAISRPCLSCRDNKHRVIVSSFTRLSSHLYAFLLRLGNFTNNYVAIPLIVYSYVFQLIGLSTYRLQHVRSTIAIRQQKFVSGFEKSYIPRTFRNMNFNCLKYCILGRKTDACMQFTMILQLCMVCFCTNQLLNEQLAELPTIIDSIFTGLVKTPSTYTYMGVKGEGWQEKVSTTLKAAKWHSVVSFSTPHITQAS